jgi:hypothetical protein
MKTKAHYIQKAREAAWILNHIAEADRKMFSGDSVMQHQGAAEREKWLGKWLNWKRANPEEAALAEKLMNQEQIKKIKEREQNDELRGLFKRIKTDQLERDLQVIEAVDEASRKAVLDSVPSFSEQETEEDKRKIEQDLQSIPKALEQLTQETRDDA